MKGLIQRVSRSSVSVDGELIGSIGSGVLLFLGIEKGDAEAQVDRMLQRVLTYRIFPDENGRMNLSLLDVGGGLLVISQFTLVADTGKGTRAGFSSGATPEQGERLYSLFLEKARLKVGGTEAGIFGADMQVSLVNDGPVTFLLSA